MGKAKAKPKTDLYAAVQALDGAPGKQLVLELAERALPVFEAIRRGDDRARTAIDAGRALLAAPADPAARRRGAIAAARAYLASQPERNEIDEAYQAAQGAATLAMLAAAPPPGADRAELERAIVEAVPAGELAAANPDLQPWYKSSPIDKTIGDQAFDATCATIQLVNVWKPLGRTPAEERRFVRVLYRRVTRGPLPPAPPERRARKRSLAELLAILGRGEGGAYPRSPLAPAGLAALRARLRAEVEHALPAPYQTLLAATDGIQINNSGLYGSEWLVDTNLELADYRRGRGWLAIGHSGNNARYVFDRARDRWLVTGFFGRDIYERYPTFAGLLAAIMLSEGVIDE
jgi:hypothetical protein